MVLLSVLSYYVLYFGGLVLSLEHDGLVCLFRSNNEKFDRETFINEILGSLSQKLDPWASVLLGDTIPLEVKLFITKDGVVEF